MRLPRFLRPFDFNQSEPRLWDAHVYLTASVNHDFLGDADSTAKLGNVVRDQSVDAAGTWVSYGLGAQFNTTKNLSFYGSLEKASGSEYREDYRYNVGFRYVW